LKEALEVIKEQQIAYCRACTIELRDKLYART
jgi:hypothetical protein